MGAERFKHTMTRIRHINICLCLLLAVQAGMARSENDISLIIECNERGIHSISGYDLMAAGVNLFDWDTDRLVMIYDESSIPVHIEDSGDKRFDLHDRLYFFAEGPQQQDRFFINIHGEYYPAIQVFMLHPDHPELEPARYSPEQMTRRLLGDEMKSPVAEFYGSRHFEKDPIWEFIPGNRKDNQIIDYLFWKKMSYPETDKLTSGATIEFEIPETDLRTSSTLDISLAALGYHTLVHNVRLQVNEDFSRSLQWKGNNHQASIEISPGILKPGLNRLSLMLKAPGKIGSMERGSVDLVLMDWFRFHFRRKLIPSPGLDEFIIQPPDGHDLSGNLEISGFVHKPLLCLDIRNDIVHNPMVFRDSIYSAQWTLRMRLPSKVATLVIGESRDLVRPFAIKPYQIRDIYREPVQCELLIITHDTFVDALGPLVDWKESSGMKVHLVTVNQIFNETSGGTVNVKSIAQYIQHVHESSNNPQLKYVLLVGDTSTISKYQSFVPGYAYLDSGNHANDNYYAAFGDPNAPPKVALGRISVRNTGQIENVVRKIIEYERRDHLGYWRISSLLISASESWAKNDAEWIRENFVLPELISEHVHSSPEITDESHHAELTGRLVDAFNRGHFLTAFFGHGGGSVWEVGPTDTVGRIKKHLFNQENVETLKNIEKPTLVLALTCYTNDFDNPHVTQTLGEVFVNSEGGAVAVIGASDRSSIHLNRKLSQEILKILKYEKKIRLGDLFLRGMDKVNGQHSMYNILGDPSLLIHLPSDGVKIYNLKRRSIEGELSIEYELPGEVDLPARAEIMIIDSSGGQIASWSNEIVSNRGSLTLETSPKNLETMNRLVLYVTDNRRMDYVGAYSVDESI
jgi:hypothetical protein